MLLIISVNVCDKFFNMFLSMSTCQLNVLAGSIYNMSVSKSVNIFLYVSNQHVNISDQRVSLRGSVDHVSVTFRKEISLDKIKVTVCLSVELHPITKFVRHLLTIKKAQLTLH